MDEQTSSVKLVSVFSIAGNSVTTVLLLEWDKRERDYSGRFTGKYQMLSYRNIHSDQLPSFLALIGQVR